MVDLNLEEMYSIALSRVENSLLVVLLCGAQLKDTVILFIGFHRPFVRRSLGRTAVSNQPEYLHKGP